VRVRVVFSPLRILRAVFLLAAIACLSYYGWWILDSKAQQWNQSRVFDETRKSEGAAPSASARTAPKALHSIGRISVPRLHLKAMVEEGDDDATLEHAVGHVPGTALPGSVGNVALAGHRDSFFRGFADLRRDDEIDLETLDGSFRYRVDQLSVVDPSNTSALAPTHGKTLTLITCFPFHYIGPAPRRFIVRATQISDEAGRSRNARRSGSSHAARFRPGSRRCPPGSTCGAAALR
jgi:sortase A